MATTVVTFRHNRTHHKNLIHKLEKAEEYLEEAIECFKAAAIAETDDEDYTENYEDEDMEYVEEVAYRKPTKIAHRGRYGYRRMR